MPDMQKVIQTKNKILNVIQERGPELPVRVGSAIGLNNLFTAAFMSELVSEQKLKISSMKVGGSPLYYIEGQEEKLQNYTNYLNHKEKEAFKLLKEKEILSDIEQEPAIRVALRNIKDFAFPIKIIDNNEEKIFWKIHTLTNDKAKELIKNILNPKPQIEKEIKPPLKKEEIKQQIIEEHKKESSKSSEEIKKEEKLNIFDKETIKESKKQINFDFINKIKEHLSTKNLDILNEISMKKKEFIAKIKKSTEFGDQEFYLIAKDKKKITLEDLVNTLQKAQLEKMPALIISSGDVDKKALDYYKEWSNLIKHQKINLN